MSDKYVPTPYLRIVFSDLTNPSRTLQQWWHDPSYVHSYPAAGHGEWRNVEEVGDHKIAGSSKKYLNVS